MADDITAFCGVWQREVNYEPRDTVADSATRDGSIVLWAQSPSGLYVDIRRVKSEASRVRGFTGCLSLSPTEETTAGEWVVTWRRDADTFPSSCPSGLDSAVCRFAGPDTLLEEGDGYLEVWHRVCKWDANGGCTAVKSESTEQEGALGWENTIVVPSYGTWTGGKQLHGREDDEGSAFVRFESADGCLSLLST